MAKEINLKEILGIIKKRLWIIVAATILATLAGYFYSMFFNQAPLYQTEKRIVIGADANQMSTLMVMIKDPTVLEKVSKEINYKRLPNALNGEIATENIDSSQVVSISVTDRDPRLAAEIANTTASTFKGEAADILDFTKVQLLSEAKINPTRINPDSRYPLIIAFIVGLAAGLGIVFLLNSLDNSIQSEQELERVLGVTALGSISKMNTKNVYGYFNINIFKRGKRIKKIAAKKGNVTYGKLKLTHKDLDLVYKGPESVQRSTTRT